MRVIRRAEAGRDAWDRLVDRSEDAWIWHRYDLCGALSTWPGVEDLGFAIAGDDGELLAALPLRRTVTRRVGGTLGFSRLDSLGGPAVSPDVPRKRRREVLERLLGTVAEVATPRDTEFQIALSPLAPTLRAPDGPRVNPLLEHGLEDVSTQSWVVDLRDDEEQLWSGLKARSRRAIRKAEKAGIEVRLGGDSRDLDTYFRLHVENYDRTGAASHPRAYFETIWERFVATGHSAVFFAELDGEVIAARNFSVYKGAALYWTGASAERALEVGANHLLQWRAMLWMREQGIEWSETGEAFPGAAGKDRGLTYFKEGFGGELYPHFRARRELPSRLHRALEGFRLLRSAMTR